MKKNLLKVFLLSVATVGMVFSSCTNYDDDINDLNQKIEDLSGKVALKADQSAVQALEQKLAGIDFSKYVTKEGLDAAIKGVEDQTKSEIEAAIKGIKTLSENDVKSIFNEQMKAYDVWGSVNTKVADAIQEALKGTLKQSDINTIIAAAVAEINKDGSDIQKAILSIVGKDMEAALANYVTKDVLNGYVTAEAANAKYTAMEAAVEAKLDAANKALVAEITKQIADNNTIQKADLDKAFAKYDKEIASLWSAVSNLAGRIQSLVYVPSTLDGKAVFGSYSIAGIGTPVSLTSGNGVKSTMTFRVSPASLAEALVNGYKDGTVKMAFLPEKLTRATEIKFEVEGVSLGKDGKIDVLARTNYTYPSVDETYAVALQVINSKKQEGETIETGIEFTSAYVSTTGSDSVNVYDNIVLVDEKLKEVDPMAISDDIAYNNTTASHKFLDGYKYAYKVSANQIITLAEAAAKYNWDVKPEEAVAIERTAFTSTGVTELNVDPQNPMANAAAKAKFVTVGLKQAKAGNIDKVVTDAGKLGIKVGNATVYGTKAYEAKLNITREKLAAITLEAVNFVWDYNKYVGGGQYEKQIQIGSGLTYEQFNNLNFSAATWTVDGAIKTANASASVNANLASSPSAASDVQLLDLEVSGYNKGTGALNYKVNVPISSVAEVEFNGVVNFKGLPEVEFPISVPAGEYTVDGDNLVVEIAEHFSDSLYKVNETALKEHFTNGANFVSFMSSATLAKSFPAEEKKPSPTAAAVAYAGLELATANGALNAYFVSRFIDFNDLEAYTFKVQPSTDIKVADAGFTVKFIKDNTVTINKDNNFFLMKGTDLYTPDGKTPYVVATGVRDGANYTIGNIDLDKAYKASKTGAVVTYELAAVPADYTGTYPTISGTILNWNGCSFNSVEVTAKLTVDGILVDVKKFNATIENPIVGPAVQAFVSETGEELNVVKVAANQAASISLFKGVTLKDFADKLVIDPVAGALVAESVSAYDVAVTYGTPAYKVKKNGAFVEDNTISFDRLSVSSGALNVSASDARLAHEIEVTVPVKLTHKYSIEKKTTGTTTTWEPKPLEFNVVFIVKNAE